MGEVVYCLQWARNMQDESGILCCQKEETHTHTHTQNVEDMSKGHRYQLKNLPMANARTI